MSKRKKSVRDLASEAGMEVDDAILSLWDAGFDSVRGPTDQIVSGDLNRARRALGLATRRELKSTAYWCELFGCDVAGLRVLSQSLGIRVSAAAKILPPKAVTRLRAEARRRGIDPITGGVVEERPLFPEPRRQRFEWRSVGQARELRWLSSDEVISVHHALVEDFAGTGDPLDPPGVRDDHLLHSAVFRPQTSNGEFQKYPSVESSAAALLHSLIQNHPFHNGNKRSAMVAMLVFLDENGFMLTCHEDDLFRLVLQVAKHRVVDHRLPDLPDREVYAISEWLHQNIRPIATGDHPVAWRKLRRILIEFGCELSVAGGVGNRMNITRTIMVKGLFGIKTRETLKTQVFYGDEGRDVQKNTIRKIREDLRLDELHGVDSDAFYGLAPTTPSDFIVQYRKTLRRLARL